MTVNKKVYETFVRICEKIGDSRNFDDYSDCLSEFYRIKNIIYSDIIEPYNLAKSMRLTTKQIKDGTFDWDGFKKQIGYLSYKNATVRKLDDI